MNRHTWGVMRCMSPLLLAGAMATAQAAPAPTGLDLSLVAATATTDHVRKVGLVAGWQQARPLWQGRRWQLGLRHELELSFWHPRDASNIVEFGYSPFLRLERPTVDQSGLFFVEASIGLRLLSHTRVSADRDLSSSFQFSDVLGLGWQWGPQGRSTLGARFQHISDAGIKKPNPGINFTQIYYRYRF